MGQSHFGLTRHSGMLFSSKVYYLDILSFPPCICLLPLIFKPDNSVLLTGKNNCCTEETRRGRQRHKAEEIRGGVRGGLGAPA